MADDLRQIALAVHTEPERFTDVAFAELAAAPPWTPGVCFNPICGKAFNPTRSWQIYCSAKCRGDADAEMRKWGHKMALPMLVHRQTKYAGGATAQGELARAARRYVTQVQTAWVNDRAARVQIGGGS